MLPCENDVLCYFRSTFGIGIGGGRLTSLLNNNASILHFARMLLSTGVITSFGIFLSFFHDFSISSIVSGFSKYVRKPLNVRSAIPGS